MTHVITLLIWPCFFRFVNHMLQLHRALVRLIDSIYRESSEYDEMGDYNIDINNEVGLSGIWAFYGFSYSHMIESINGVLLEKISWSLVF